MLATIHFTVFDNCFLWTNKKIKKYTSFYIKGLKLGVAPYGKKTEQQSWASAEKNIWT
jgi:hypothetical protein